MVGRAGRVVRPLSAREGRSRHPRGASLDLRADRRGDPPPGAAVPGNAAAPLAAAGIEVEERDLRRGAELPRLGDVDGLLVLGGDQSVRDIADTAYLQREAELLREAVAGGVPVLGVCLGGQMLAHALGGEVTKMPARMVRWAEVERLPAADGDPVFGALPKRLRALHWNEDAFSLPDGWRRAAQPGGPGGRGVPGRGTGVGDPVPPRSRLRGTRGLVRGRRGVADRGRSEPGGGAGGRSRTPAVTNLSAYMGLAGLRVLLVDLDMSFGDVGISLQLMPKSSVRDVVAMSGHLDEQGVSQLVTRHEASNLDVICAPADPSDADRIPVSSITELLKVARGMYDYVVVDTPPSFTEAVLASCDLSDLLVLIATLDIPAIKNLKIALETLDMIGSPRENRLIVLNRSDAKVGLSSDDVVNALKTPIAVHLPSSASVPASINRGVAIVVDEPRHPVSVAVRELADVHIRPRFGAVAPTAQRRSFFRSRR